MLRVEYHSNAIVHFFLQVGPLLLLKLWANPVKVEVNILIILLHCNSRACGGS